MFSTARTVQRGRWRSTEFAGKCHPSSQQCTSPRVLKLISLTFFLKFRDAFTTSGDFIISPHAAAQGLYVAACGSFHGWKFFPVLGKYVVQMMEGELSPELKEKWAWDRERPDPALFADFPRFEMKDLLDESKPLRAKL